MNGDTIDADAVYDFSRRIKEEVDGLILIFMTSENVNSVSFQDIWNGSPNYVFLIGQSKELIEKAIEEGGKQ